MTTAQADRIEMLPMIKRIDGRTVSFVGETMKDVMNGIVAVVGLAEQVIKVRSLRKNEWTFFL